MASRTGQFARQIEASSKASVAWDAMADNFFRFDGSYERARAAFRNADNDFHALKEQANGKLLSRRRMPAAVVLG
jgi:hypothetical protein